MFYHDSIACNQKRIWNWIPLLFSSFYFLPLVMASEYFSTTKVAISIIAYIAFIALYAMALHQQHKAVLTSMLLMLVLCTAMSAITPGTQALFGFVAFFAGFHLLRGAAYAMLALILGCITVSGVYLAPGPVGYFLLPAWIMSLGIFFFGLFERRERQHAKEKAKSEEQIEHLGAVAERERIARDLHDVLGHSLSSIALKSELAQKQIAAGQVSEAQQEIVQVSALARELLTEVRQAVAGMKKMGLPGQLEVIKNNLEQHGISCEFEKLPALNSQTETALCYICTEAATNILRHAKDAKSMRITFTQTSNELQLKVADDGQGNKIKWGNGLTGINERCQQLGGYLELEQKQGTTLICHLKKV